MTPVPHPTRWLADMPQASPDQSTVAIQCQQAAVQFGSAVFQLGPIDLDIQAGEIVSLIGPSGCGKTTLLRAIAGLQPLSSGSIQTHASDTNDCGEVGFVFQQPALLPWADTLSNVQLPLDLISRGTKKTRQAAAIDALRSVQLEHASKHSPGELSGGMQMRASVARALVTEPKLLLLDEPFAALDDMLRQDLGQLLISLWQQRQFTAVMVTHNIAESIMLSHRIAIMRGGKLERVIPNPLAWPRDESIRRTAPFGEFYGLISDALRGVESVEGQA